MRTFGHTSLAIATLLAAAGAVAQSQGDWVSYRDAYRQMVVFEKYGKPKQHLQSSLQVVPLDAGATLDGLSLALDGRTVHLNLPLDATGRTTLPLLKAAYDENAVLRLNRGGGKYSFRPRISIGVRADGLYQAAELREACEQALAFERHARPGLARRWRCAGVSFTFGTRPGEAQVRHDGQLSALPVAEGRAFPDLPHPRLHIATYRFADWPQGGQVIANDTPLSIAPVFE